MPVGQAHRGPDRVKRASRNWTVEEPPKRIRDFVTWYVWLRETGRGAKDYALWNGTNENTISRWIRDPRVVTLIETGLKASNAGPERVQTVLDMLHRKATTQDDVQAARLYLETVDRLSPRRVEVTVRDARSLSDEELRVELRRAMKIIESRTSSDREDDSILDADVLEDSAEPVLVDEILDAEVLEDRTLTPDRPVIDQSPGGSDGHEEAPRLRQGVELDRETPGNQPEAG